MNRTVGLLQQERKATWNALFKYSKHSVNKTTKHALPRQGMRRHQAHQQIQQRRSFGQKPAGHSLSLPAKVSQTSQTELCDFITRALIPLAVPVTGLASGGGPGWQTKAFHARVRATHGCSFIRSPQYCMEASNCTLRLCSSVPGSQNNVGISWSSRRQVYIFGIHTTRSGTQVFPSAKTTVPAFLALLNALGVDEVFLYDMASVKCRCGVAVPFISIARMLAGEGTLYELFPGRFKHPVAVLHEKGMLQQASADQDVCRRFIDSHRTHSAEPCLHASVNDAVARARCLLELSSPGDVFAYQEYTLFTAGLISE